MVDASIAYLADMPERPTYYFCPPPPGVPWRNTKGDRRTVTIHDARHVAPDAALDREGFTRVASPPLGEAALTGDGIRERAYRSAERLVAGTTGAARVHAFDHNLRSAARDGRQQDGAQGPVRYAHNDYTAGSGPQRVRDVFGAREAAELLRGRVAVINVWQPIRHTVENAPLAVCDARTIAAADLVPTDLHYRDRIGEVYSLRFNPAHRWYSYSAMQIDEALLLKCFDSDPSKACFSAHSAFDAPRSPADAPPRESLEIRTLAFFA
jgi:hypothetical protein